MPTTGDASESGLIKFFQPISDITKMRNQFPVTKDFEGKECRLPFNSTNKYAYSINDFETPDSYYCIFTKGAPERIWKLCTNIDVRGKPVPIDHSFE
jgi:sodium/potassium-transporting ATPase subunit alpha